MSESETNDAMPMPLLDPEWDELDASGVVQRLSSEGRLNELIVLWRTKDPALAVLVAPSLVASAIPVVADLVASEALRPTRGEPVTSACLEALRAHPPILPESTIDPIVEALRISELPPSPVPQGFQGLLELLVLAQEGDGAATVCRMVAAGETADSELAEVRVAAYRRSLQEPDLASRVVELVYERFMSDPPSRWEDAARLIETFGEAGQETLATTIINATIHAAANTTPIAGEHFPPSVAATVYSHGLEALRAIIDGAPLPITPGALALAELIDRTADKRRRKALFTALARNQASLFEQALPRLMPSWDEDDWRWHLTVLVGDKALQVPGAAALVTSAPATGDISSLALRLALEQPEDASGELLHHGASRLKDRLEGDDELTPCERVWWPSRENAVSTQRLRAWLDAAVDTNVQIEIVIDAYQRRLVDSADVPDLLPSGAFPAALQLVGPGELRTQLVVALFEASPGEAENAVAEVQSEHFAVDVAGAAAAYSAAAAFTMAEKAWPDLSEADRDQLMDALEAFATVAQVDDVLATVLRHTHASNTARRARAAARIAQLLPPGADLPEGVLDLLASARPELRDAGAAVLGAVRPRDVDVVRRLSQAAVQAEGEDEAAVAALRSVQDDFLDRLAADPDTIERIDLLDLLGAVATPGVIDPLLDHLGEDAVDDDVSVRRAAARSLGAVSAIVE